MHVREPLQHVHGRVRKLDKALHLVRLANVEAQLALLCHLGHGLVEDRTTFQDGLLHMQRLHEGIHVREVLHGLHVEVTLQNLALDLPHPLEAGDRRIQQLGNGVVLVLVPYFVFQRCHEQFSESC